MMMLKDKSIAWDERWGDVLHYALFSDQLSDDQAKGYMQRAIKFKVSVREQIGMDTTQGRYHIQSENPSRGRSSYAFHFELAQAMTNGGIVWYISSPYRFRVDKRVRSEVMLSDHWMPWMDSNDFSESTSGWTPFEPSPNTGYSSGYPLPVTHSEFNFEFELRVMIDKFDQPLYEWEIVERVRVQRVDNPVYVTPVDVSESKNFAESVHWIPMRLPSGVEEYRDD